MTTQIYYHKGCPDGQLGAWIAYHFYKDSGSIELIAFTYADEKIPDVTGVESVVIVDFSFSPEVLFQMADQACSVVWLDHHQTAIDAWKTFLERDFDAQGIPDNLKYDLSEDNSRSGAMLAFDWFVAETLSDEWNWPMPESDLEKLVRCVDNRDRWVQDDNGNWKIPDVDAAVGALATTEFTIEAWDALLEDGFDVVVKTGAGIEKYRNRLIETHVAQAFPFVLEGQRIHLVNAPHSIASEVCARLCAEFPGEPFSGYFFVMPDHVQFGLRSASNGADVGNLATLFGGGGHTHASGFSLPLDCLVDLGCTVGSKGVRSLDSSWYRNAVTL